MLSRKATEDEMNVVTLIGNLASDVDLRALDGDKQVANFLLAVDRPNRDGADFVRISVWDKQAESCARYLVKGKRIALDGRLRSRSWDEDGKRRNAVEVVARNVQFLSPADSRAPAEVPFEGAAA
jgi:single-strand DNA-binding protein